MDEPAAGAAALPKARKIDQQNLVFANCVGVDFPCFFADL
jgi:hypothetical protein